MTWKRTSYAECRPLVLWRHGRRRCDDSPAGHGADGELADVRAAGFTDGEVAEIIAHVALNVFTNYFNRACETEIDFPRVTAGQLA